MSLTSSHRHTRPHAPPHPRAVDPKVWRACAGSSVTVPTLHSRVYYFPQGHLEHATSASSSSSLLLSPQLLAKPLIPCRVADVSFLADPITDEVFAKVLLHPIRHGLNPHHHHHIADVTGSNADVAAAAAAEEDDDDDDKVVAFAKVLTPSDSNNGGGFSVPRFCADSIFPPLNFEADPPVQKLSIADLHGVAWEFRHIYRGTPRRHLLTTGWSKFVNSKMLVAGDSVVFMRRSSARSNNGEMYVGVRRTVRADHNGGGDCGRWSSYVDEEGPRGGEGGLGFKARLSREAVVESAELAANEMPFEVVYYPKAGWADFVVKAEVVERALKVFWSAGMRVKIGMETDDSSRMTWFQGTLSSVFIPENGAWKGSPWRMLQVTWDEPEVLQNAKRVNPWQVNIVASTTSLHPAPPFHTVFPVTKRFVAPLDPALLRNGEDEFMIPMTGAANSAMGQYNASLLNYNIFPAGMQGARQDLFGDSNASHLFSHSFGNNNYMVPSRKRVSTELNIGSSQDDQLSRDSQSSSHSVGTEPDGNRNHKLRKLGSSFQLFGQTIAINHIDSIGCTEDGDNIGYNQLDSSPSF